MKKKRIAFVVTSFQVGGVERALLTLLDQIDRRYYDVTVFLPDASGAWTEKLQEKEKVVILRNDTIRQTLCWELRHLRLFSALRSLFYRRRSRKVGAKDYHESYELFIRSMRRYPKRFDLAAAYQIVNDDCVLACLYRIRAQKRIAWSHATIRKENPIYTRWYDQFDKIFCVSEYARRALLDNMPALQEKVSVYYNHLEPERLRQLALDFAPPAPPPGSFVVTTVGRLSPEKGQLLIPKAARLLCDSGLSLLWYVIGDGASREELASLIRQEGVEDRVLLLGNLENPYPYMRLCDVYVQTSLTEGWGLTVSEAKALGKAIVTTDAGVMAEQIRSGRNGLIVPEATSEALAEGIRSIADHPELKTRFTAALAEEDLSNAGEIQKLYALIDG